MPQRRNLVGIQQAADYVGLSTKTIRRYISSGELHGYRVGKKLILVDLNELDQLIRPIPTTGNDAA